MRHLKAGKRLGVTTSHRKAMMRNLVTALLEHGEIRTTVTRAKEMRKYFDKMIGLGKRGDLHARRQAMAFVKSKTAVEKLFGEYGSVYGERNGGYTRIYRLGRRLGDNSQMVLIQMVGHGDDVQTVKPVKAKTDDRIAEIKAALQADTQESPAKPETKTEMSTASTAVDVKESSGMGSSASEGSESSLDSAAGTDPSSETPTSQSSDVQPKTDRE
jgi:large subunit ribosomal protein L17